MRVLLQKHQNEIYKSTVEVLKVLAPIEGDEASYAIGDMYKIAQIVGGDEMTNLLKGGMRIRNYSDTAMKGWKKDELIDYIRELEGALTEKIGESQ